MGPLPPDVVQALSKLKAQYGSGSLTGEQGFIHDTEASVASGALVTDKAFSNFEVPEGSQDQASAAWLMELACPPASTAGRRTQTWRVQRLGDVFLTY